uniref:Uncharacterized protein n=1 Tax=Coccidioides posadasii RMSCC 3488 TaxID=454284 RepID=A0A0J6F0Z2_COCPO|nr:hypothetical protein CPAG_02884 [Coccidioides posadasii RMSCC 3488]
MARSLSPHQLQIVVLGLAQKLDSLNVDYASMGGAAGCLLTQRPDRETEDVDLVIHVDHRMITADRLISQLLASFPSEFGPVIQSPICHQNNKVYQRVSGQDFRPRMEPSLNINARVAGKKGQIFEM